LRDLRASVDHAVEISEGCWFESGDEDGYRQAMMRWIGYLRSDPRRVGKLVEKATDVVAEVALDSWWSCGEPLDFRIERASGIVMHNKTLARLDLLP
jgi:hypothetical protein